MQKKLLRSHLFALPAEIRNIIWGFTVPSGDYTVVYDGFKQRLPRSAHFHGYKPKQIAVTDRQLDNVDHAPPTFQMLGNAAKAIRQPHSASRQFEKSSGLNILLVCKQTYREAVFVLFNQCFFTFETRVDGFWLLVAFLYTLGRSASLVRRVQLNEFVRLFHPMNYVQPYMPESNKIPWFKLAMQRLPSDCDVLVKFEVHVLAEHRDPTRYYAKDAYENAYKRGYGSWKEDMVADREALRRFAEKCMGISTPHSLPDNSSFRMKQISVMPRFVYEPGSTFMLAPIPHSVALPMPPGSVRDGRDLVSSRWDSCNVHKVKLNPSKDNSTNDSWSPEEENAWMTECWELLGLKPEGYRLRSGDTNVYKYREPKYREVASEDEADEE